MVVTRHFITDQVIARTAWSWRTCITSSTSLTMATRWGYPACNCCRWCHTQRQISCPYLLWVMSHTRSGLLFISFVGDVTHKVRPPVYIFCGWCHTQGQASCLYLLWVMSHASSGLLFISFVGDVTRKVRPPVYIFCGWCHTQGQASCLYLLWVMSHRTRSGFLSVSFVGDVTTRSGLLPVAVACGATLPTDNQCLTCTFTDRAMHCSMEHVWLTGCWNPNSQFIVQGQIICTLDHKWESREFMSHWYPVAFGGPAPLLPHIRQCQGLNHNGKASITQSPSNHITGV